ncbi:hypothetical protein [Streptomyces sp. NPDC005322]|uniref:hypothetical protein n=1 Tax=Streptomyces sp. NPDC005322 TaxID=3157032 RepID=UPI0033B09083
MLTLGHICGEPDFSLRFAGSDRPADPAVDSVRVIPGTAWRDAPLGDVSDALVVIDFLPRSGGQPGPRAVERLLRELARQRAAGLALTVDRHGRRPPRWPSAPA